MGTRVYVGNLAFHATEGTLRDFLATSGNVVSVSLVTDRMTGQSRGFGFVEYATEGEAKAAIAALNGVMHEGRPLTVNEAKERTRGDDRGSRGGHKGW